MKKNILFVVDENRMGGVSILLEDMLNMIDIKNKNIDVLVLHDSGDKLKKLPKNVNVIYGTPYFSSIDYTIKEVLKSKDIKKIIKKIILVFDLKTGLIKYKIKRERKKILNKKYDIEIAFKDGFTAIFTAFGNSSKKIHWLHYDYKLANPNAKYKKLFNNILKKFDNIIAVSKGIMDDFNNIYHLENKTNVISNLVNIEKIIKKSKENKNKKNRKKLNIISVGRLHSMKGYDRLIEVVDKLTKEKKLSNIELQIFGDGPEFENLNNLIKNKKLNNIIKLMGRVNNPYIYIKNADLFILSSVYEPFGLVIVEALTLGIPVLATKNSATDKLIKNKYNGMVVENSIDGLYEGLKDLINNKEKLDKLKENALTYDYSTDNKKIIEKIEQLFS